jgi:biopolymer transport protein ExbD
MLSLSGQQTTMDFGAGASDFVVKIQVAPLVDTVLFLIWFYLLVGQLVMYQKDPTVELPRMDSPLAQTELPAEVVVNLRQDGLITVSGQAVATAALAPLIAAEMAKARQAGQELRVVVRPDRRQRFARLDEVLQSCRRAGLTQVVFRAKEGGDL